MNMKQTFTILILCLSTLPHPCYAAKKDDGIKPTKTWAITQHPAKDDCTQETNSNDDNDTLLIIQTSNGLSSQGIEYDFNTGKQLSSPIKTKIYNPCIYGSMVTDNTGKNKFWGILGDQFNQSKLRTTDGTQNSEKHLEDGYKNIGDHYQTVMNPHKEHLIATKNGTSILTTLFNDTGETDYRYKTILHRNNKIIFSIPLKDYPHPSISPDQKLFTLQHSKLNATMICWTHSGFDVDIIPNKKLKFCQHLQKSVLYDDYNLYDLKGNFKKSLSKDFEWKIKEVFQHSYLLQHKSTGHIKVFSMHNPNDPGRRLILPNEIKDPYCFISKGWLAAIPSRIPKKPGDDLGKYYTAYLFALNQKIKNKK